MIQRILFFLILAFSTSLFSQEPADQNSTPGSAAIDEALKHKTVNGKGFKDYFMEAHSKGVDSAEYIGKNLGTENFTHFCILGNTDKLKDEDYHFYFIDGSESAVKNLMSLGYIVDHNDVTRLNIFSSDGTRSYGSFSIYNKTTGASGRFLFRYNIKSKKITELLIPRWNSDKFATAYPVFGDKNKVKDYKRPLMPAMKIMFGGSPIEILMLFFGFIMAMVVLKNCIFSKGKDLGAVLTQFQVVLVCIGAFGICGTISFFGSLAGGVDRSMAMLYFESLLVLITKFFCAAAVLLIIMLIKLKPKKHMKFWMYSNLLVIPASTLGLIYSIVKLIFGD